jgi:hypothetical protein
MRHVMAARSRCQLPLSEVHSLPVSHWQPTGSATTIMLWGEVTGGSVYLCWLMVFLCAGVIRGGGPIGQESSLTTATPPSLRDAGFETIMNCKPRPCP